MNIKQIYNLSLEMGMKADPRGKAGIDKWLKRTKKLYEKLTDEEKKEFDQERLTNPYSDSRIHFGDPEKEIKTAIVGIDMEGPEIMLAAMSGDPKIDLIIAHHPEGKALAALDDVMHLQADLMAAYGVPINVGEGVMKERILEVNRSVAAANHMRTVDMARRVNMPLINIHTPTDNLVYDFLQKLMDSKKPDTVADVIEILKTIPEYKEASLNNAGPAIIAGAPENSAGKVVAFDITGGTNGAKEIYPELVKAGVGTVIGMHMKDEAREEAIKNHLNVVIAGHISSDSIGMNLFLDKLEERGAIKIIPISGLIRVNRSKK